jgi:hypothetical protein
MKQSNNINVEEDFELGSIDDNARALFFNPHSKQIV